jgi:PIN domain nuclease of toxin-antitoxin system
VRIPCRRRAKLFALADLVGGSGDDTAVVLEQRGGGEGVALVREARLNYLEDVVKQMEKPSEKPFTLAGSLSSELDDTALTELLKDLRKEWGERAGAEAESVTRVAVTDSHALIWYAIGPGRRLGRAARALFARAERGEPTIYVPTFVLVEVAEAIRRGGLRFDGGFLAVGARALLASGGFAAADLTAAVVLEAEGLYAIPERGDRLIAATAVHLECPLITRDSRLGARAVARDGDGEKLRAVTLHAIALGLVGLDQGRELRLKGALRGVDLAERAGDLLLLQLVFDGQRQLREPLEMRARMELQFLELCQHDEEPSSAAGGLAAGLALGAALLPGCTAGASSRATSVL